MALGGKEGGRQGKTGGEMGSGEEDRKEQGMVGKEVGSPPWAKWRSKGGRGGGNGRINVDGEEKGGRRGPQNRNVGGKNCVGGGEAGRMRGNRWGDF